MISPSSKATFFLVRYAYRLAPNANMRSFLDSKRSDITDNTEEVTMMQNFTLTAPPTGLSFTLEIGDYPTAAFAVVNFEMVEQYNDYYHVDIQCAIKPQTGVVLDCPALLGCRAVLSIWQATTCHRQISGIIQWIEEGSSGTQRTYYRLRLVPNLYRLTLRSRCRLFQQKSIQQIIETLLQEHHIAFYSFAFKDPHPVREYCVQYRETDFAFLQRITGEEGIFFFCYDAQPGQEGIAFVDDWRGLPEGGCFPYNPHPLSARAEQVITQCRYGHQLCPQTVSLRDYTFKNPTWLAQYAAEKTDHQAPRSLMSLLHVGSF